MAAIGLSWLLTKFLKTQFTLILILLAVLLGQLTRLALPGGGSLVANDLLIPAVLFIWLLGKLAKNERLLTVTPVNWPLGVFLGINLISLAVNVVAYSPPEILASAAYLARFTAYAGVFYLTLDVIKDRQVWQQFFSLAIGAGFIFAGLGFLQLLFIPSFEFMTKYGWDPHFNRLLSTFFDPNYAGGFLVLVSSLLLGKLLYTKPESQRWLEWLGLITLLAAIAATYSRSAYLALTVALAMVGLLKSWRLLLAGIIGVALVLIVSPRIQERIVGALTIDVTAQARLQSFKEAFEIIQDRPILGAGYNTLRYVREKYGQIQDPRQHTAGGFDSSLLTIWATSGILGLGAFLWIIFEIGRAALATVWRQPPWPDLGGLALGILAGGTGLIIHSQFVNSLLYPHILVYLWFLVGLLFAGRKLARNAQ